MRFLLYSGISSRFLSSFRLPTNLIATACDMVVFCIQNQIQDEEVARKEAASWAEEVLSNCGEFLSNHLRKSVGHSLKCRYSIFMFMPCFFLGQCDA